MITASLRSELAPTGQLRVGINYGNPVLAKKDPQNGELRGVAVDLASELARRVGIPLALVGFESAGKMFEAVKASAWDAAFLAIDPTRGAEIDFTPPYIEIEGTYLAPKNSPLSAIGDVDHDNVRIGVSANRAYDLFLSRSIQRAQLVRAASPETAIELLIAGKVDVLAGVRQHLMANAVKFPGSRLFEGRFMAIQQAVGIPKGRPRAREYLRDFIEGAKASGLVARAIEKAGVGGVSIPPAASIG